MPLALRPWLTAALAFGTVATVGGLVFAQPPAAGSVQRTGGFSRAPQRAVGAVRSIEHVSRRVTARAARAWLKLQRPIKMDFPNETPLADVLDYVKKETADKDSAGLTIYVEPAADPDEEPELGAPVQIQLEGIPLAKTLRLTVRQLGLDYWVRDDGVLVISSADSVPDDHLRADDAIGDDVATLAESIKALRIALGRIRLAGPGASGLLQAPDVRRIAQRLAPGFPADGDDELKAPRVSRQQVERRLSAAASKVWISLSRDITFKANVELPLQDALAQFREATQAGDDRLQIYVDPVGLARAERTMQTPIVLELEGVPAASVLELMLKQLRLRFVVDEDGLIVITADSDSGGVDELRDLQTLDTLATLQSQLDEIRRNVALYRRTGGPAALPRSLVAPASRRAGH